MDSNKLANWLQVGANIGLLGGLVLVAIQINQNSDQLGQSHQLVRAELLSNFYDAWITIDSSKQSENFAEVLSKSIAKPKDLSLKEMVITIFFPPRSCKLVAKMFSRYRIRKLPVQ